MKTNVMSHEEVTNLDTAPEGIDKSLYYVRSPYINFTKEGNTKLRERRILNIPENIFKVWICRYITDISTSKSTNNSEWFTFSIENDEIVAGFVFEDEAEKFKKMLDEIKQEGFPLRSHWTVDLTAIV